MLARLRPGDLSLFAKSLEIVRRPDKEVYDIPGALPIGLADFEMVWARPK